MNNGEEDPAVVKPLKILHANARINHIDGFAGDLYNSGFLKNRADGIILKIWRII
jgi:hypothetical protein